MLVVFALFSSLPCLLVLVVGRSLFAVDFVLIIEFISDGLRYWF